MVDSFRQKLLNNINRYTNETTKQLNLFNKQLETLNEICNPDSFDADTDLRRLFEVVHIMLGTVAEIQYYQTTTNEYAQRLEVRELKLGKGR